MDLIPQIATVIIYILIALVIVIFISYLYSKFSKKNHKPDHEELYVKRKKIRQYIIDHHQKIASNSLTQEKNVIAHAYSAPTFSSRTGVKYFKPSDYNLNITDSRYISSTENKLTNVRYSIVNKKTSSDSLIKNIQFVKSIKNITSEQQSYPQ